MFDIGFSEIVVIAVVALVVLGPEKLPKTARTLGHLFGRLQRYVNDVKSDIKREMELDELRKLQEDVQSAAREIEGSMTSAVRSVEADVREAETKLRDVEAAMTANPPDAVVGVPPVTHPPPAAAPVEPPQPPVPPAVAAAPAPSSAEPPRQPSLPGFDRG